MKGSYSNKKTCSVLHVASKFHPNNPFQENPSKPAARHLLRTFLGEPSSNTLENILTFYNALSRKFPAAFSEACKCHMTLGPSSLETPEPQREGHKLPKTPLNVSKVGKGSSVPVESLLTLLLSLSMVQLPESLLSKINH